jgi:AraC-like DNA-binding protein
VTRPKNAIEIHYVLTGTMHLHTPGRQPVVCHAGSLALIPPRMPQTMAADDHPARDVLAVETCSIVREGMMLFDAAGGGQGDLRVVCGSVAASVSGSYGLLDGITEPIVEQMSDIAIVKCAYTAMLQELDRPALGSRALMGALMKTCLMMTIRQRLANQHQGLHLLGGLGDHRIGKAVAAVLDRPAQPHSVATLAAEAGMSRSSFAREFSRILGQSPMEFVMKTRLHRAAQMLLATTAPVKAVAASAGFSSRSHFSRAFRDAYGVDPSRFRTMPPAG